MAQRRDVYGDPDWTDTEAEGAPPIEDQPPGIDAESAQEGQFPPRDRPVGVNEPQVTAAGDRRPETLEERVRREVPDVVSPGGDDLGDTGRLVAGDPEDGATGEWQDDRAGLSAEEDAVHTRDI